MRVGSRPLGDPDAGGGESGAPGYVSELEGFFSVGRTLRHLCGNISGDFCVAWLGTVSLTVS